MRASIFVLVVVAACGGGDGASTGAGGSSGVGGSTSAGGSAGSGGAAGSLGTGGTAGSGGSATGGTAGSGGSATGGTAGSAGTATGGTAGSATGGTAGSAGTATGGTAGTATGGAAGSAGSATGGGAGTATGGTAGTAGTTSSGGTTATGGGAGTAGAGGSGGALDVCNNAAGQLFPGGAPWNTPITSAPLDAESAAIIGHLQQNHATAARFQIDFSLEVLTADASTPRLPFTPTGDFYTPHCDPAPMPIPAGGNIEGETGYECTTDGDCHLLVVDRSSCRLYEQWRTNIVGSTYEGGCAAIWDLGDVPPLDGRGDYCTSADGAGLPIAPLLFDADEVAAGEIRHALRFILPNDLIRDDRYVRPGTHCPNATSGGPSTPVYSMRLRLRAGTDLSGLNPAARVVARALQTYGMFLADGGNLTFVGRSDRRTTASWTDVGLGPHDLKGLAWSDFEVVDAGQRLTFSAGDCTRTPITN